MSEFLPKEVREGLVMARKQNLRRKSRMRVTAGEHTFTVLRYWDTGFALDAEEAPNMRGLVDLYDGSRHMSQCLIVASLEEGGERVFEFKRATMAEDYAPLEYERTGPVALIDKRSQ